MSIDNLSGEPLTEEQLQVLRDTTLSHNHVAALIGKSYASIKYHRNKHNIHVDEAAKDIQYWADWEVQYLADNHNRTNVEIANFLGRTEGAVALKRQRLDVPSSRDYWEQDELEYLDNNYSRLSVAAMSQYLGRSIASIQSKAFERGVTKKSTFWSKPEIEILQKNIDLVPSDLEALLPNKTVAQITYKKSHLNFFNKQKAEPNDGDIERGIRISKSSATLRYMELLNTLEVGESLEYPAKDNFRVSSARRELAHKVFISKKEELDTRRIWRIE